METTDQSISRDNGLLDYARLNDITLQAWSPFRRSGSTGYSSAARNTPSSTRRSTSLRTSTASHRWHRRGVDHAASCEHPGRARYHETLPRARGGGRQRHPLAARSGTGCSPPPAISCRSGWRQVGAPEHELGLEHELGAPPNLDLIRRSGTAIPGAYHGGMGHVVGTIRSSRWARRSVRSSAMSSSPVRAMRPSPS